MSSSFSWLRLEAVDESSFAASFIISDPLLPVDRESKAESPISFTAF
jgi:hypothetical protein